MATLRKFGIFCLIVFFSAAFTPHLLAQGVSYRLDKSKVRLMIPPSSSGSGSIKIYNQTKNSIKIKAYLEDWLYEKIQDGAKEFFPANTTKFSCASWIQFSPAEFTLSPFGINVVNFVAKVPADAKGSYLAVMFFETETKDMSSEEDPLKQQAVQSGVSLAIRLGSLFYIDVKGTVNRSVELTKFNITKDPKGKNYLISLDLKNDGNADITTETTYHISDKKGMIYARGKFSSVYTLPEDTAQLSSSWKESLAQGLYDIVLTLNLGKGIEEANLGRGPIIVKEAKLEVGSSGEIVSLGALK